MSPVRVLVVEDQEPFRLVAAAVIQNTPAFVLAGVATTAEQCLSMAAGLRVDLVLMDVNLPGMDGVTAAERLAELADAPRVLLLSTYSEDEIADRLSVAGCAAYLPKSRFGSDQLVRMWALLSTPEPGAG